MDNALMLAATLAPGTVRSKVLATLLRLAGAWAHADEMIALPCKQSEIAEMTGLTRNSIGPAIRDLVPDGLIVSSRNQIAYNPARVTRALGS